MEFDFSCNTFGKCIVAGEHSVLRGIPAVVFPVRSKRLELQFYSSGGPLSIELSGQHGDSLKLLMSGLIDHALKLLNLSRSDVSGTLKIHSTIPVGAGLGASAAVCVAVARWMSYCGFVPEENIYEFARNLEDLFHGESSGVDIAASLEGQGIWFERGGVRKALTQNWQPHLYISYSGQIGVTSECVSQVKRLFVEDAELAEKIDKDMFKAVKKVGEAFGTSEELGQNLLMNGIYQAGLCFQRWGLTKGAMGEHMSALTEAGALAVKPTGSGGGGFVLSLWEAPPKVEILETFELTPIY